MNIKGIQRHLSDHPVLGGLGADHLELLAESASGCSFEYGGIIIDQGEMADHFYLLLKGIVAVETEDSSVEPITIQTLQKGDLLGWSWLFPPYRWHFTARAIEHCELLVFDGEFLRVACRQDPVFGMEMMNRFSGLMMERLESARHQLIDFYRALQES